MDMHKFATRLEAGNRAIESQFPWLTISLAVGWCLFAIVLGSEMIMAQNRADRLEAELGRELRYLLWQKCLQTGSSHEQCVATAKEQANAIIAQAKIAF
jgi:hypothetical protein